PSRARHPARRLVRRLATGRRVPSVRSLAVQLAPLPAPLAGPPICWRRQRRRRHALADICITTAVAIPAGDSALTAFGYSHLPNLAPLATAGVFFCPGREGERWRPLLVCFRQRGTYEMVVPW